MDGAWPVWYSEGVLLFLLTTDRRGIAAREPDLLAGSYGGEDEFCEALAAFPRSFLVVGDGCGEAGVDFYQDGLHDWN